MAQAVVLEQAMDLQAPPELDMELALEPQGQASLEPELALASLAPTDTPELAQA